MKKLIWPIIACLFSTAYGSDRTCHGKLIEAAEHKAISENKINPKEFLTYDVSIRRAGNNMYIVKLIRGSVLKFEVFTDYEEQFTGVDCSITSIRDAD